MTFEFTPYPGEPAHIRIGDCVEKAFANGRLSDKQNGKLYREVISCGQAQPMQKFHGVYPDIGQMHTSCAVFAGAILHWCGWNQPIRPGKIGWPMFGGWLGDLSFSHKAWRPNGEPLSGDLFYIQATWDPNNNHVGFMLEEVKPGLWITAEGGGGDGTECYYRLRRWGPDFDKRGKPLGFWAAAMLGLQDTT